MLVYSEAAHHRFKHSAFCRRVSALFSKALEGDASSHSAQMWNRDTVALLGRLRQSPTSGSQDALCSFDLQHLSAYTVQPDHEGQIVRFRTADTNQSLHRFLGISTAGVDILRIRKSGFEYHWRSDLIKVLEEKTPYLGRLLVLLNNKEEAVDHLCLPIFSGTEIVEIRGWFICADGLLLQERALDWEKVSMVRRTERAQPISLPRRLLWPAEQNAAFYDLLRILNSDWRSPCRKFLS
jgi:hypothetical protein